MGHAGWEARIFAYQEDWGSRFRSTFASSARSVRRARWLLFVLAVVALGVEAAVMSVHDARQSFGEMGEADWAPTNIWLKSAECARQTGAWLVLCDDDGRLRPIMEEALGDDPGHALLLAILAMATDRPVTLLDVANLNLLLNGLGFLSLAAFLFALRSYVCAFVFLYLGPVVYLGWTGVSPHWGLLGVASMAAVLPMAIVATDRGFLTRRQGMFFVALGFLGLVVASLIREAVGLMALAASLSAIVFVLWRPGPARSGRLGLGVLALAIFAVHWAPYALYALRDALFVVEPAQLVQRHGFSDILYMGLGAVPNRFGIAYDDYLALDHAQRVDPDVVYCSPDFYRIMWSLYFDKLLSHPDEVVRIYIDKAGLILADPILESGPPLGVVLAGGLFLLLVGQRYGLWRRLGFPQGQLVLVASLVFIGLFVAQAILASPNRGYAMPIGAAILTLTGLMFSFLVRGGRLVLNRLLGG